MDITPPRDDIGTEQLGRKNRRRDVTRADHIKPANRLPSTDEWHEQSQPQPGEPSPADPPHPSPEASNTSPPEGERRSGEERRRQERRRDDRQVLFDTRSEYERRTELRRREDRERAEKARRGIDIKA